MLYLISQLFSLFYKKNEPNFCVLVLAVKHKRGQCLALPNLFVILTEQATLKHILISFISGVGAAFLLGGLCFFLSRVIKVSTNVY